MKPYYADEAVTLYHGDCRDILPTLSEVDHIVTDPPYNVRTEDIELPGRSAMKRDFGLWDEGWSATEFLSLCALRVRPGGSLLSFTSDRLLSEFRTHADWTPRGTLVWEKLNPAPHPRPAYVQATEWIVWLVRPGAAATWLGNGYTPNILRHAICGGSERTEHPTQKPESVVRELIGRHTEPNALVLDPYAGSGTTLRAAKRLGRRGIGIEMNERYCEIAALRLSQGSLAEMFQ